MLIVTLITSLCCGKTHTPEGGRERTARDHHGILRITAQTPRSLDPIYSHNYWESELVLQLFDGLLRFDRDLNVVPAIAQDWRVSADGRTYTFCLRQGVRFHNGREVTAGDFAYSMTRLLDARSHSMDAEHYLIILGAKAYRSGAASLVEGLRVLDKTTLQISLEQAYTPFLRILAQQPASVVPREEVEKAGESFAKSPIGTGAFRFKEWSPNGEILLEANGDYFDGPPQLEAIQIKTVSPLDARSNFQDFAEGKLDIAFLPSEGLAEARANPEWVCVSLPVLRFMYLGLNLKDPLLKNPDLREAICAAVDRTSLVAKEADYEPISNLIPASLLGSQPGVSPAPFNFAAARRAFLRARHGQTESLRMSLWHASLSGSRTLLLSRLAANLESVGIEVNLKIVPSLEELLKQIYSGKTQMFLLGEVFDFPDPAALLNRLFHSQSQGNPFAYGNPAVDRMLEEAQTAPDESVRVHLYRRVEQQILNDHVVVPLFQVKYSIVTRRAVQGVELTPLGFQYLPFRNVWLKEQPRAN